MASAPSGGRRHAALASRMQSRLTPVSRCHITFACVLLVACIIGTAECLAHRDRRLTVTDDGAIVGIPSQYGAAALHVAFESSTGDPKVSAVVLDLGRNHTRLPDCVTRLLTTRNMGDIEALASWYHDESIVPYYLALEFFGPGYSPSRWANSGHELLFDLRTGRLLQMKAMIGEDQRLQFAPVDLR